MSNEEIDLRSKLEVMRRQLESRDQEIASLVAEATINKESFFTEVTALRADLIVAQSNLKRESSERAALESGFVTEDNYLTIRYAAAQKGVKVSTLRNISFPFSLPFPFPFFTICSFTLK